MKIKRHSIFAVLMLGLLSIGGCSTHDPYGFHHLRRKIQQQTSKEAQAQHVAYQRPSEPSGGKSEARGSSHKRNGRR